MIKMPNAKGLTVLMGGIRKSSGGATGGPRGGRNATGADVTPRTVTGDGATVARVTGGAMPLTSGAASPKGTDGGSGRTGDQKDYEKEQMLSVEKRYLSSAGRLKGIATNLRKTVAVKLNERDAQGLVFDEMRATYYQLADTTDHLAGALARLANRTKNAQVEVARREGELQGRVGQR